jgi:abnormal spindle-like microcephaly-associated protein
MFSSARAAVLASYPLAWQHNPTRCRLNLPPWLAAGTAREHLHKWIAAASVVQRAVRAWRLRLGLERFAAQRQRGVAAVVRLQALWRGRPVYRQYQQLRQAAICFQVGTHRQPASELSADLIGLVVGRQLPAYGPWPRPPTMAGLRVCCVGLSLQAAYRGKQARRAVFHQLVVPRMLEAGLQRKRQVESSRYQGRLLRAVTTVQALRRGAVLRRQFLRQRAAAVAIQAAVRCRQQRARFQQQRAAAVVLQKHFRGFAVRREAIQQRAAATAMQTAWRRWQARRQYLQLQAAAVTVQSAWRARQARLLLQQHKAARCIQAAWRGFAVRKQMEEQQQAAVCIQAAWRCFAARRAFQHQRQAAVRLQAAVRRHAVRSRFLLCKQAAVRVQAAWRGFAVRHLLHRNQAAVIIQRWVALA